MPEDIIAVIVAVVLLAVGITVAIVFTADVAVKLEEEVDG
jgi:hypothetical protein